jgi:hypothetical protein
MRHWWVNQGKTIQHERKDGYLWSTALCHHMRRIFFATCALSGDWPYGFDAETAK